MKELDFSSQIRAKFYPIEECDDCALAAERFGGKKRSELKDSDFLDSKRRSFPVMSCKDVKDAVSTWGLYKGPMTFESFKSKLTSKAKSLGCEASLPKEWSEESEAKDWEKIDKKELKRDTKKEKGEHEKDAIKDDQKKIDKLKKGKPSEKKSVEELDLERDQEFDEADKEKYTKADDKTRQEKMDEEEGDQDKKELKQDTKKEKKEHYKDAVKQDKKEIKDLEKDEKFDKKDS